MKQRVRDAALALRDAGVESVAICFLFSYLNPAHEDRAKAIVSEILPDAFVTTSSFVSPQFREFERFTTAALAAFIGPKVRTYITHLDRSLKSAGLTADLRIMASNGGVATADMVSEKPTLTLLSGLAAGVLAGAWIGELAERRKLITFDIGGTSADIGIIVDGRLAETDARSTSIAGFPAADPDDRHPHDRRGRRLDRLYRPRRSVSRRAAQRGRRSGTGGLRNGAAKSRPSPTPISFSAGSTRTTSSAAA